MEDEKTLPSEDESVSTEKVKTPWQLQKESWYDKIPLNVKQLDWIIWGGMALLVIVFVIIFLDALDIFNPFGY